MVVDGSGRAADLLAIAFKYAAEGSLYSSKSSVILDGMLEPLMAAIQRTFSVDQLQAEKLLNELLQCVKKKHLITIFKPSDSDITGNNLSKIYVLCTILRLLMSAKKVTVTNWTMPF